MNQEEFKIFKKCYEDVFNINTEAKYGVDFFDSIETAKIRCEIKGNLSLSQKEDLHKIYKFVKLSQLDIFINKFNLPTIPSPLSLMREGIIEEKNDLRCEVALSNDEFRLILDKVLDAELGDGKDIKNNKKRIKKMASLMLLKIVTGNHE